MSSSSSSSHDIITYTYVSSDTELPSWGILLMEAYESDPEAPLAPVLAHEYPEYLALSDDEIPAEDQPLTTSPIALSPGYIADSEPIENGLEEDPEMDPIDYVANEEEEKHLAPTNSTLSAPDFVPSGEETKPFETDESATIPPPPRSPQTIIPLSHTGLCRAQKTDRPQIPLSSFIETHIVEYAIAPTPSSPPPSSLSPLSSPLPLIPSPPLLLPSLTLATARQTRLALASGVDYRFINTLDASIRVINERVMTTLEGVNKRMTDLAATHRHDSDEFYMCHQDAQEDRALLRARISTLER
ncbi:hypothetical protein Tco_0654944 [Tanacetum coccineum]|uniref:Uncharacterized protein n=1 Tax=Tanacetum coccineum TaxID=301880 RepID=A0ABQ4X5K7_9ASTR